MSTEVSAERLAELRAEHDRPNRGNQWNANFARDWTAICDELKQRREREAAMEKDAARYRFMQSCRSVSFQRDFLATETKMASSIPLGDSLNIAVDYWMNLGKESRERIEKRDAAVAAMKDPT
jgi:hypothetical protein